MPSFSVLAIASLLAAVLAPTARAQVPAPDNSPTALRFEVATIKPSAPDKYRMTQIRGNRFVTIATSVVDLLKYADGLQEEQIVAGPAWLATQKFDILADPETDARPSSDEFKLMVQALLTDRFHLAAHRETRVLSVFEITIAKGGPKLTASTRPPGGIPSVGYAPGGLSAKNASLGDFAAFLQRFVADHPVVDATGITGRYDLNLRWTPDELQAQAAPDAAGDRSLPGLFTAIQEQLGLKLEEAKRPAPVLVIDHLELPSEN